MADDKLSTKRKPMGGAVLAGSPDPLPKKKTSADTTLAQRRAELFRQEDEALKHLKKPWRPGRPVPVEE